MKKLLLLFALVAACGVQSYAQKTVFKFRDAQSRAADAVTEIYVKPEVVEVEMLQGKIQDVWTLTKDEVEIGMKGELSNIRAWGTYLSCKKNDCDIIMAATYKIEDDDKGAYTVTVVGFPGRFVNWHSATPDDYEWMRIQRGSGTQSQNTATPVVKSKN